MAGPTIPTLASLAAMDGDVQLHDIYVFFAALLGESYPTAGALPSTGNWVGRLASVEADKTLRRWDGSGWVILFSSSLVRYTSSVALTWTTTNATVAWDTSEVADTSAWTYSAGVFTCVRAGRYRVEAQVALAASGGFNASLGLYVNGSVTKEVPVIGSATNSVGVQLLETRDFAVNDTVQMKAAAGSTNNGVAGVRLNRITLVSA